MLVEDHFVVNVAKRIGSGDRALGPYHQHYMSIELNRPAVSNRREAIDRFAEVCRNYPEPAYSCTLTQVVCRGIFVCNSEELFAEAA